MKRILITGSRDWSDPSRVAVALVRAIHDRRWDWNEVVVVHGACRTGADAQADIYAEMLALAREPHPADWNRYRKRAGVIRNSEMIKAGADLCLAFIGNCTTPSCSRPKPHGSHGASHCADAAEKAGIETIRYLEEGP